MKALQHNIDESLKYIPTGQVEFLDRVMSTESPFLNLSVLLDAINRSR